MRSKPDKKNSRGRNGGFHIENKTGTKPRNKGRAKKTKKTIKNVKQFRFKMR